MAIQKEVSATDDVLLIMIPVFLNNKLLKL